VLCPDQLDAANMHQRLCSAGNRYARWKESNLVEDTLVGHSPVEGSLEEGILAVHTPAVHTLVVHTVADRTPAVHSLAAAHTEA